MELRARDLAALLAALLLAAAPARASEPARTLTETIEASEAAAAAADAEDAAAPAVAEDGAAGAEEGAAGADLESYWSQRLARAQQRIDLARERVEKTDAAYSRARHDRNPRGGALEEVKERRTAAERELASAEAALPRLVEQARRAGVPAGVLRDYWGDDE